MAEETWEVEEDEDGSVRIFDARREERGRFANMHDLAVCASFLMRDIDLYQRAVANLKEKIAQGSDQLVKREEELKREKEWSLELQNAWLEMRDAVLHERHELAEMGLENDQVNAVLDVIDRFCPERAMENRYGTQADGGAGAS